MKTINLDRKEIEQKIAHGDTYNGSYVLACDGEQAELHWLERNRPWEPYWLKHPWQIIELPALDPDGSGQALEDAQECLRSCLSRPAFAAAAAREYGAGGDQNWLDLAEELCPEDWAAWQAEQLSWLADEWLHAANGECSDLRPGYEWSGEIEAGYDYPPAPGRLDVHFGWASRQSKNPSPPHRTYRIVWTVFSTAHSKVVNWATFRQQARGLLLSCYIVDQDNTTIATSTWSARPLNERLAEVNAAFGRHNVAQLDLDPQANSLSVILRDWQPSWGYYPDSPPWHAASLAATIGKANFASWRSAE